MNNDLISRSALIKALNEAQIEFDEYYKGLGKAKVITDNAPTIDKGYDFGYADGHGEGYELGKNSRPQGKWIFRTDTEWHFECNQCKGLSPWKAQFCGVCGADMRGAEDE